MSEVCPAGLQPAELNVSDRLTLLGMTIDMLKHGLADEDLQALVNLQVRSLLGFTVTPPAATPP